MEAPEKLYLSKNIYSTYMYQVSDTDDDTAVEYTRTDAFVEKAEEWLRNNQQGFILTDKDITDFVNYLKGDRV